MGVLVVLLIFLQFIMYAMHRFSASTSHIWTAGKNATDKVVRGFRKLTSGHGG